MSNREERDRFKIDVSRPLAEMERLLQNCRSGERRQEIVALLRCWQHDEGIDNVSRARSRVLVRTYGSQLIVDPKLSSRVQA